VFDLLLLGNITCKQALTVTLRVMVDGVGVLEKTKYSYRIFLQ